MSGLDSNRVNPVNQGAANGGELDPFFELAPDCMALANRDGQLQRVNASWERCFGHPDRGGCRDVFAIAHPDDRPQLERDWASLTPENPRAEWERRCQLSARGDRRLRWIVQSHPNGESVYLVGRELDDPAPPPALAARRSPQTDRLAAIVAALPQPIYLLDRETRVLTTNDAGARLWGHSPESVRGKPLSEFPLPAGSCEAIAALHQHVFETAKPRKSELPWKSGKLSREYEITAIPMTWTEATATPEEIDGALIVVQDVGDRKALQKELAWREELWRAFFSSAPAGMAILNHQLRYVQINERLAEMKGLSVSEQLGKAFAEVMPNIAKNFEPIMRLILASGEPMLNIEVSGQVGTQTENRTWDASLFPLFGSDDRPKGLGLIMVDITDRKQAEAELKAAQTRLQNLLAASPMVLYSCDPQQDYRPTFISENIEAQMGYSPQTFLDNPGFWEECVHPQDRDRLGEVLHHLEGRNTLSLEYRFGDARGNYRWLLDAIEVLRDRHGQPVEIVGCLQDITERKQASIIQEELLRRNESLVEALGEIVYDYFVSTEFIVWDGAYTAVLGYSPAEMVTDAKISWLDRVHPDDLDGVFKELDKAVDGRRLYNIEYRLRHRDGFYLWMHDKGAIHYNERGEAERIVGILTNITERKQAEQALRDSEARFRQIAEREALLNQLTEQIRTSLELDTILETAVTAIRQLLYIDRCHFIWFHRADEADDATIKMADSESCEISGIAPGQSYWEIVKESRREDLGDFVGCYPQILDPQLSDRLLALEPIRLDDLGDLPTPSSYRLCSEWNYTALVLLPLQTLGGEIGAIACGHHSGPRPWKNAEIELLQAAANQLAIAIHQAELYKKATLAASQAQAQTKQLEATLRELQQTQTQLIQTEKMSSLGQMVAGVAHEINNPVNFITGNLQHADEYIKDLLGLIELYRQHYPDPVEEIEEEAEAIEVDFLIEDLPKLLSSMKVGADRIREIVRSLRNFSRLDEAKMKPVDIHEGIESTLLILHNRLKGKGEKPEIKIVRDYDELPLVECYGGELNQVFMNLLANAIDALEGQPPPHRITIRTLRKAPQPDGDPAIAPTEPNSSERVFISISDNGPGMNEEVKASLFDPFFTTKPVGKGTGLGLAISYQIVVDKHQGQLWCESQPDRGAKFCIEIPVAPSPTPPPETLPC
ncbi:PAS domain S-box protein [Oxynema aestuarii]|uniref:histidine kinase n=1 Tax=Oxynema aestuarii AP17 TaxID=2064643 RepID=A0A6H1U1J2_9CYAN|nr:PAS domain S-box protein [Oxynema aestuarii]QIZ71893.1 PAS domain S-box protein [Oxynema aestuarii AP17]